MRMPICWNVYCMPNKWLVHGGHENVAIKLVLDLQMNQPFLRFYQLFWFLCIFTRINWIWKIFRIFFVEILKRELSFTVVLNTLWMYLKCQDIHSLTEISCLKFWIISPADVALKFDYFKFSWFFMYLLALIALLIKLFNINRCKFKQSMIFNNKNKWN